MVVFFFVLFWKSFSQIVNFKLGRFFHEVILWNTFPGMSALHESFPCPFQLRKLSCPPPFMFWKSCKKQQNCPLLLSLQKVILAKEVGLKLFMPALKPNVLTKWSYFSRICLAMYFTRNMSSIAQWSKIPFHLEIFSCFEWSFMF